MSSLRRRGDHNLDLEPLDSFGAAVVVVSGSGGSSSSNNNNNDRSVVVAVGVAVAVAKTHPKTYAWNVLNPQP